MAFNFNKLKDELVSAGKEVGDKVSEVSEIAKKKYEIHSKEDLLEKQFAELGRKYYADFKKDEQADSEKFSDVMKTENEIKQLKEELLILQGAVDCPVCGLKQDKGNAFCTGCGASIRQ